MRPVGLRLGSGRELAVCFRRGAFWGEAVCKASPARGGGCAVRRRRRGALPAGGGDILQRLAGPCRMLPQGTMLASSRKPCGAASLKTAGENARPTLRPGAGGDTKAAALCQARRRADASIGPYAGGRAATPGAVARIRYIVGRAFTPAGEVCGEVTLWFCVRAAPQGRGGLRQPERVLARSCAAPLSRLTPTAPLTGEPFGRKPFAKPPL